MRCHRSARERKNSRTKEGFVDAAGCPATEPTEFWLGVGRVAEGQEKGGARMVVNQWLTVLQSGAFCHASANPCQGIHLPKGQRLRK